VIFVVLAMTMIVFIGAPFGLYAGLRPDSFSGRHIMAPSESAVQPEFLTCDEAVAALSPPPKPQADSARPPR
jgi:ABC-type glutathione transport system ATPase component